jgi:hypothetical protein
MTMTGYKPEGKNFEERMQDVLERRVTWLIDNPNEAACTVLVNRNDRQSIGFWLTAKGVAWAALPRGGPLPSEVAFTGEVAA